MKNPPTGGRADTTRRQILFAAAHQFARRAYHDVGLDDILAEAELTKGAMYFHFRSKHALAMAVIDEQNAKSNAAFQDLMARKLSGLETLVDSTFVIAVHDINEDLTRAALHLVEAVGRVEALHEKLLGGWVEILASFVSDGITEGDISEGCDPHDLGRLVVSVYMDYGKPAIWTIRSGFSTIWKRAGAWCWLASCSPTEPTTSANSSADAQPARSALHRRRRSPIDPDRKIKTNNPANGCGSC